jgi:RIO kinase 1
MKNTANYLDYDDLEIYDEYDTLYGEPKPARKPKSNKAKKRAEAATLLAEEGDSTSSGFNPTFSSSRHERKWIIDYLGGFYEDQIIADVLRQVKGGKEATVYCCEAHPDREMDLIAAKVYRPRIFRTLKNDQLYREGGNIADESGQSALRGRRARVAMQKKTEFGHTLLHNAWLSNEYAHLQTLHAAGALVPQPYAMGDNVILMEYLGEVTDPAPPLINVRLERSEALPLFRTLIDNIDLMLQHQVVHGDLSPHNILYWDGEVRIIDFPQAVASHVNPHSQALLMRDVERVCQYFARYGVESDPRRLARDLWGQYLPL